MDLAAEGGYLKAVVKEFVIMPTAPSLMIELRRKVQNPILNGIEIYAREVQAPMFGTSIPAIGLRWEAAIGLAAVL